MIDPSPTPKIPTTPQIFEQTNGRTHKKYTLTDEGVRLESHMASGESANVLWDFERIGVPNGSYYYEIVNDRSKLDQTFAVVAVAFIAFGCFGAVRGLAENPAVAWASYTVGGIMVLLGIIFGILGRGHKAKTRGFVFTNGFLQFYYRNTKDINQVDAFEKAITARAGQFWKKKTITLIQRNPANDQVEDLLEMLQRGGFLDDAEYQKYQKIVQDALSSNT